MITLTLLAACFTPATEPFDWDVQTFQNDYTGDVDTLVLRPFQYDDLLCPDGQPATFFAVYDSAVTTPMPVAIVSHSGAFDYVNNPNATDPLVGNHYAGEDRLTADWASDKVFETFGLLPGEQVDPTEVNAGTLPAALALQGVFAIYPANCWGDLWHNEDGDTYNDYETDVIHRNGRFIEWAMTTFVSKDPTVAAEKRDAYGIDVTLDSSGVYLVGLGDGGRAIPEVIWRQATIPDANFPTINGILVDSSCDDLSYYVTNQTANAGFYEGLQRIYGDDIGNVSLYSLRQYLSTHTVPGPVQVYLSGSDPQVPDECNSGLVTLAQSVSNLQVINYNQSVHVFLNNDMTNAMGAVSNMLGTAR